MIDADGLSAAPVFNFDIVLASDTIATAPGTTNNPVSLRLTLTVQNPCRGAVFSTKTLSSMIAYVHHGAETQVVTPFVHTLESSAFDCGLQQLSIVEDGAFSYSYSEFIAISS